MDEQQRARARAFFAAYDAATHPMAAGPALPPARLWAMEAVSKTLINRVRDRLQGAAGPPRLGAQRAWVEQLSALQLGLYRAHYGLQGGALDYGPLGEAFLRFANGDLRDARGSEHGQPNGAGALLFAEFALLVRDWSLPDWAAWRPLLPALARMGRIWLRVYAPPPETLRQWDAWSYVNYRPGRRFTEEELGAELAVLRQGLGAPVDDALAEQHLREVARAAFRAPIPRT